MYKRKHLLRKLELDTLQEIINNREYYKENSQYGISILLNGSWGSGKTDFVNSFKENINPNNYNIMNIYNAFEYDFYENAFIPFFSFIKEELKIYIDIDKLLSITTNHIAKNIISILFKATNSFLKSKTGIDFSEIKNEIESIGNEYIENNSDYNNYIELKKIKENIKKEIKKIASKKPIILIIDELDRCKPSFAIETLEIIKYFFDIENLIIILSLDRKQLEESAKSIYGYGINSDIYFSKFFDYQFNLNKLNFIDTIDFSTIENAPDIVGSIEHIFNFLNISTRDSYKIFNEFISKYNKYYTKGIKWTRSQSVFILFIITIKNTDLMLYNSILNETFNDYKNMLLNSNDIDKKKYIQTFSFTIFNESSIEKSIKDIIRYGQLEYGDIERMNHTSHDEKIQKERDILKTMNYFLPKVLEEGTYMDNYKHLFNN